MAPGHPTLRTLASKPVLAIAVSVAVFLLAQWDSIRPVYAQWDKAAHGLCFLATWWAFHRVLAMGRVAALLLAAALGALIELHQIGRPSFDPSWLDFLADLAGIACAWAISRVIPVRGALP